MTCPGERPRDKPARPTPESQVLILQDRQRINVCGSGCPVCGALPGPPLIEFRSSSGRGQSSLAIRLQPRPQGEMSHVDVSTADRTGSGTGLEEGVYSSHTAVLLLHCEAVTQVENYRPRHSCSGTVTALRRGCSFLPGPPDLCSPFVWKWKHPNLQKSCLDLEFQDQK